MGAWGFSFKTVAFVWIKLNRKASTLFTGMGYWTRANAEICLLATRGHPKRQARNVHQVIASPVEEHSKKPEEARRRIVALMGDVPRVELFARQHPEGWDVWGNEVSGRTRDLVLKEKRAFGPLSLLLFDDQPGDAVCVRLDGILVIPQSHLPGLLHLPYYHGRCRPVAPAPHKRLCQPPGSVSTTSPANRTAHSVSCSAAHWGRKVLSPEDRAPAAGVSILPEYGTPAGSRPGHTGRSALVGFGSA